MVEDSFSEDPLTDDEKKDESFEDRPPWFKQPPTGRPHQQRDTHVSPKYVLTQLISKVDDLPACLFFYPVSGQPHSIQGTWLASNSEYLLSLLCTLGVYSTCDLAWCGFCRI